MTKFQPIKMRSKDKSFTLTLRFTEEQYDRIIAAAEKSGISKTYFGKQAVIFALENME